MSEQLEQVESAEETGGVPEGEEVVQEAAPESEAAAETPEAAETAAETTDEAPAAAAEAPAAEEPVTAEEPAPAAPAWRVPTSTNPLSRPHVVDLSALLKPIPGENPSGEYLRYSGVYDEINEARRSDDTLSRGEWQQELKVAEFGKVIATAVPALENQSKDLQLAALLSEALVHEHGFAGLRDSLYLLAGFQKVFWDTLHPEIYEGDMEGRANAISLVDAEGGLAVQKAPITPEGYSYLDFLDSKKYELPSDIDSMPTEDADRLRKLEAEAIQQGKVTADRWAASVTQSRRAFYEELNVAIEECLTALKDLNLAIEEKFDMNQAPSTRILKKALDDIKTQTDKILEQKRQEEPDETDVAEGEEGAQAGSGTGKSGSSGPIQSRAEALKRLSELASFFRKTEPHSPVSYLVTRAVKWGNMPLESWLKDVIKDENILFQIRQTLGFNTSESDESAEEPSV